VHPTVGPPFGDGPGPGPLNSVGLPVHCDDLTEELT
jgi:hypothetical protein